ncbi:hypothetical protein [Palleronia sp.]|uniref:hypothetical protein n=1 Tax=Palleronia sp. TaxID=1940284 RepID=UPI0035C7B77F
MPFDATNPFKRKPAKLSRLPRVVRLYILHATIGFGLSGIFTGTLLGFDVAGLGHLVSSVSGGWLAALVFFMLNGIVFAGVQTGIVVMGMTYDDAPGGGRRRAPEPVPIPVRAR